MTRDLDQTLGTDRELLAGLPDDYPTDLLELEKLEHTIVVDSRGEARRVVTKRERRLIIRLTLPVNG